MTTLKDYVAIRDRGLQAMMRGDLKLAVRCLEEARDAATECLGEDKDVLDKAEVNLAMVLVQTHEDEAAERGLREVLLRSANDDVIRLAGHCLAKVLSHRNEHEKAMRYARLSLEKSRSLGQPLLIASELALVGNVLANQSYFEQAIGHYEEALRLLEESPLETAAHQAFYWGTITDSVGYALLLLGKVEEGRLRLQQAHERALQFGITDLVAETASDLCFAALQQGDLDEATRHGEEGLAIADEQGYHHLRRNFYYLLGEVASRRGDDDAADRYFAKLGEFFPHVPFIGQFLREYDISGLVNLKEFA